MEVGHPIWSKGQRHLASLFQHWTISLQTLSGNQFLLCFLQIVGHSIFDFQKNKCFLNIAHLNLPKASNWSQVRKTWLQFSKMKQFLEKLREVIQMLRLTKYFSLSQLTHMSQSRLLWKKKNLLKTWYSIDLSCGVDVRNVWNNTGDKFIAQVIFTRNWKVWLATLTFARRILISVLNDSG